MASCKEFIGYAFNNPDETSDYHAPDWGLLVTPDELRYDELFGNALTAEADGQSITDEQLLDYARLAIAYLERELNIDILPRLIRYNDRIDSNGNKIPRSDIAAEDGAFLSKIKTRKQRSELYIREAGYPYRLLPARYEAMIKLRRRPVRDVISAKFADPYTGRSLIDLMPFRVVKQGLSGTVFFKPRRFTGGLSWDSIWSNYFVYPYSKDRQDVFLIDYTTGFENVADVPDDLRMIAKKIAACTLMNIYGDGKFAAIASRSVSLNSVSESISTTMSATSAAFGARILQYQKEIKSWLATNKPKYARVALGVL